MAEALMAFRAGDREELGRQGAIALAEGLVNLRCLKEAYFTVHKKR